MRQCIIYQINMAHRSRTSAIEMQMLTQQCIVYIVNMNKHYLRCDKVLEISSKPFVNPRELPTSRWHQITEPLARHGVRYRHLRRHYWLGVRLMVDEKRFLSVTHKRNVINYYFRTSIIFCLLLTIRRGSAIAQFLRVAQKLLLVRCINNLIETRFFEIYQIYSFFVFLWPWDFYLKSINCSQTPLNDYNTYRRTARQVQCKSILKL